MNYSYTQISEYLICPRQFHWEDPAYSLFRESETEKECEADNFTVGPPAASTCNELTWRSSSEATARITKIGEQTREIERWIERILNMGSIVLPTRQELCT